MNRSTKTEIKKKAIISLDYIHYNNENNYYLILNMDFYQYNFDKIIMETIIPLIKQEKEKFVINKKNE